MNAIITVATGMVGKGVLLECLDHTDISKVLSISRKPTGIKHRKLEELIHADFSEFHSVKDQLSNYDACFACMGVSAAGLSEEEYTRLTYDYTMALAQELLKANTNATFVYVSGQGTKSNATGGPMWARVKGKTENDLLNLGFSKAFMFRPGIIIPLKGIEPSSKLYRRLIRSMKWSFGLIKKIAPNSVVDTSQVGLAMINAAKHGYRNSVVNPKDIILLARN